MTSDGIADADWELVQDLTVAVVDCSADDDEDGEARAREALLARLDELDRKYGPKPSLLALRADYVEWLPERERLLHAAYAAARRIGDDRYEQLVAYALAAFYIERVRDFDEGANWLATWRSHLGMLMDAADAEEFARLETLLLSRGAS